MNIKANYSDRRRHKRYKVNGAYAVNSCSSKSGLITDISREGLSFRYIDRKAWSKETCEIDILYDADDFYLDKIPVKSVSDFVTESDSPDGAMIIKRHSIKFEALTPEQESLLEYFIENHTVKEGTEETMAA